MAVTTEILRSYRAPREVMRRQLRDGPREDRALIYLMSACLLIFVSNLPRLAREAAAQPEIPLDARIGGALFGWLILAPLGLYALAAISHILARLVGGKGSWWAARMALFWALLAAVPLFLLNGLAQALLSAGPGRMLIGSITASGALMLWSIFLSEAEKPGAGGEKA